MLYSLLPPAPSKAAFPNQLVYNSNGNAILGDCDIPGFDGCYSCSHWRTNKNFLPILRDTLERTKKVLEKALNYDWELQIMKNKLIKHNLEQVIKSLEAEDYG